MRKILLALISTLGLLLVSSVPASAALPYEKPWNLAINCDGNWIVIYSAATQHQAQQKAVRWTQQGCATDVFEAPTYAEPLKFGDTGGSSAALTYGWHWAQVVDVYDATPPGGKWRVSQAVQEWGIKSGVVTAMTTDMSKANIVVGEEQFPCGYGAAGCAYIPDAGPDGVMEAQCRIGLNETLRTMGVAEHIAIHEIGHCLGLSHADTQRSVMFWSVSANDYFTRPQAYDYRDMKSIYGR